MSSAERCRVVLPSRISRIFRRGSVTFRPALRRSLPSTGSLRRSAIAIGYHRVRPDYPPTDPHAPTFDRRDRRAARGAAARRLHLSDEHPARQLPGGQDRGPAAARHDAHPGALPARLADDPRHLRQGPLGLPLLLQERPPGAARAAPPGRALQGRQGRELPTRPHSRFRAACTGQRYLDPEVPEDLAALARLLTLALHALAAARARIGSQLTGLLPPLDRRHPPEA